MSSKKVDGQRMINGGLNYVDIQIIKVLKGLLNETANPSKLRQDRADLLKALEEADKYSKLVADITPPGCIPPPW